MEFIITRLLCSQAFFRNQFHFSILIMKEVIFSFLRVLRLLSSTIQDSPYLLYMYSGVLIQYTYILHAYDIEYLK